MSWELRTLQVIALAALPIHLYVGLRMCGLDRGCWSCPEGTGQEALPGLSCLGFGSPPDVVSGSSGRLGWVGGAYEAGAMVLDPLFLYPIWFALIASVEMLAPFLVLDIIGLIFAPVSKAARIRRGKTLAYTRIAIVAIAVVYVPCRVLFDTLLVEDAETRL